MDLILIPTYRWILLINNYVNNTNEYELPRNAHHESQAYVR